MNNRISGKSFLVVLVLLALAIAFMACSTPAAPAQPTAAPAAAQPTAVPQANVAKKLRVAFLTIQDFGTPFEGDIWNSIIKAQKEGYASDIKLIELKDPNEYVSGMRAVAEQNYDVIIPTFDTLQPAVIQIAPQFPNIKFVEPWVAAPSPADKFPNVRGYIYQSQEGSYVAGVMAAMLSSNHHVGFIGGDDNAVILRFFAGFEAGVKSVDPNTKIDPAWAGTYVDPNKGYELGSSLFDRGCDVIMQAANKTGLGVILAAGERKKYVIGVDVDQSKDGPDVVIASALSNPGDSAYKSIVDAATGKWTGGTINFGVASGEPAVAYNPNIALPAEVTAKAKQVEADIKAGKIQVPITTTTR